VFNVFFKIRKSVFQELGVYGQDPHQLRQEKTAVGFVLPWTEIPAYEFACM